MTIRPYFRRASALGLLALALAALPAFSHSRTKPAHAARPAGVDVRAVRLWAGPDSTRVVLDLSGSAQHTLSVLKNPDRVVLDVSGARLASEAHAAPAAAGAVKQVRMATRPSGELRIVFDLAQPIRAKSFLTQPNEHYGYRLVIDLGGAAATDTPVKVEHCAAQCARSHHRHRRRPRR